jgi:antibiotic biosynthesis monooxygenase (ABM) superfamily enzyme
MYAEELTSQQARRNATPAQAGPPTPHEMAVMVWLCVFPTLTVLNLVLGGWLVTLAPVLRTLVLATIAVPVISYGLMPPLNRLRVRVRGGARSLLNRG